MGWAGAGAAPYNNVIGIDPQLRDPEHGDYRLAPGSPAAGYGCQTFLGQPRAPGDPPACAAVRSGPRRRDVIDVSGSISVDTVWEADLVRVVGDVVVKDGVTLTIVPAVRVEFQDYYTLYVEGTVSAVGTPESRILFTTDDPQDFVVDSSHTGCWNGLRFENTRATNAPSRLAYCILEYSKATGGGGSLYPYGGGALSAFDFSMLSIEDCIFRNNVADYGGALFFYRNANPRIAGNLMVGNHALQNASAIYCAYAHPQIVNNTIVGNPIHNLENPYIDSCAVLSFIAKPVFTNNIIRDNDPDVLYLHSQLWSNKDYYTRCNDIEGYASIGGNIDADPTFADPDNGNYDLAVGSPCIDAGDTAAAAGDGFDLDGRLRVARWVVDMGAYEVPFGDLNCDGRVDFGDINPFVLALSNPTAWQATYPGCELLYGDISDDQALDLGDINPFVALLVAP